MSELDKDNIPSHIAIIMDPTKFFDCDSVLIIKLAGRESDFGGFCG